MGHGPQSQGARAAARDVGAKLREHASGLVPLLGVVVVLSLLHSFGAFRIADGYVYDRFLSWSGDDAPAADALLVIEAPGAAKPAGGTEWDELVEALLAFEPARIVFSFLPERPLTSGPSDVPVILGRPAWPTSSDGDEIEWAVAEQPEAGAADRTAAGLVALPPAEHGIVRRQRSLIEIDGHQHPAVELLAAKHEFGSDWAPPEMSYLVDFRGGPLSLPKLGLEHALSAGGLVEDLVRNRTILVGFASEPGAPRLHVPLIGADPISGLEFHAFALRTLLAGAPLTGMGALGSALILLASAAAGGLLYSLARAEHMLWLMLAAVVIVLGASLAVLRWSGLFVPVTELVLAQVLLALAFWNRRSVSQAGALRALIRKLAERTVPDRVGAGADPWAEAAGLVEQVLDLKRSVFLEVEPGTPRLRPVAAVRCTTEDMAPGPRDIRRAPYAVAMQEGGLGQLDPPFFKVQAPEEEEYIIVLAFAGQVIGFWVFTIDAAVVRHAEGLEPTVTALAEHIASLICLSDRDRPGPASLPARLGPLARWLSPRREERELHQRVELVARRLDLLGDALSGGSTATAVYDVFGRARYANRRMIDLARAVGVDLFGATVLDLIAAASGASPERARRSLGAVLMDRQRVTMACARAVDGQDLLLTLTPGGGEAVGSEARGGAKGPRGVLCELQDVTPITRLLELKRTMAQHLDFQLRNDLESVTLAANLLADPRLPDKKRGGILNMLHAAIRRSRDKLSDAELHLGAAGLEQAEIREAYPLDPREAVEAAARALTDEARRRRLTLRRDFPEFVGLVLAGDRELHRLVAAILSLVLQDARDGTTVVVRLSEQERTTTLEFNNTGFGLPEQRLQELLFEPGAFASSEFQTVRAALPRIDSWQGALEARGGLGEGLAFILQLKRAS
jgi:CHASE2 domain-containing sensor protein/signal transduction histidine kinase